jgi:hypothetical protein
VVIDPILQSTYLGGEGDDSAEALAVHPKTGDIYVAGKTNSANFPKTAGGAQESLEEKYDAYVARLSADLASTDSSGNKTKQKPSNSKRNIH